MYVCVCVYVYQYRNLTNNVLKCANIFFSHQCLKRNLTPNYAKKEIPCISPVTIITKKKKYKTYI